MPYQSAYQYQPVPARVTYLSTRLGARRARMTLVRGKRVGGYPTRLGASFDIGSLAGMGSNALVPGAGSVVAPIVDSIAQVFGPSPVTGPNAERRSKIYGYYGNAMTAPGSAQSVCAVQTLQSIALQAQSPPCNGNFRQNNPQATRTFAQEALQALASQGWIGTNGPNPQYVGIPQSGNIYAPNAQGQQQVVAQAPLPTTPTGMAMQAAANPADALSGLTQGLTQDLTQNPMLLVGAGIVLALLLTRRPSQPPMVMTGVKAA